MSSTRQTDQQPDGDQKRQATPAAQAEQGQQAAPGPPAPTRGGPLATPDLLRLQRSIGNQATGRLLAGRAQPPPAAQATPPELQREVAAPRPARLALQDKGPPMERPPEQPDSELAPAVIARSVIQRVAGLKVGVMVEVAAADGGPPWYGQITNVLPNGSYEVRVGGTTTREVVPAARVSYHPALELVKDRQLRRELLALRGFLNGIQPINPGQEYATFIGAGGLAATIDDGVEAMVNMANKAIARETIAIFQYLHSLANLLGQQVTTQLNTIGPATYPDYCREYLSQFGIIVTDWVGRGIWAGDDTRDALITAPNQAVAFFQQGRDMLLAKAAQVQGANADFSNWLNVIATELGVKSYMRRVFAVRDAKFAVLQADFMQVGDVFPAHYEMSLMDEDEVPLEDDPIVDGVTYWLVDGVKKVRYQVTFATVGSTHRIATVNQQSAQPFKT